MPKEFEKILKYNPGEKPLKAPFVIYADLKCLLEKIDSCQNDTKNLLQKKKLSISILVTHGLHAVHLTN